MNEDRDKEIERLVIRGLTGIATERGLDLSILEGFDLMGASLSDLKRIHKLLHELTYAPPPRGS